MEREKEQRKEEIKEEKRRMALELVRNIVVRNVTYKHAFSTRKERNKSYSVELKRILPCIKVSCR